VSALALSPDNGVLATASRGNISLWDVRERREVGRITGGADGIQKMIFSDDGQYLASLTFNNVAKIWDIKARRAIKMLPLGWSRSHSVRIRNGSS